MMTDIVTDALHRGVLQQKTAAFMLGGYPNDRNQRAMGISKK